MFDIVRNLWPFQWWTEESDIEDDYVGIQMPTKVVDKEVHVTVVPVEEFPPLTKGSQSAKKHISATSGQPEKDRSIDNEVLYQDECIVERDGDIICETCHFITRGEERISKMIRHSQSTHHQRMISEEMDNQEFKCDACNHVSTTMSGMVQHFQTMSHQSKVHRD